MSGLMCLLMAFQFLSWFFLIPVMIDAEGMEYLRNKRDVLLLIIPLGYLALVFRALKYVTKSAIKEFSSFDDK